MKLALVMVLGGRQGVAVKVYLVSDGCYSDYSVLGIYSTRTLAEKAHELYNADNEIEEFDLDDFPDSPPGMQAYKVDMDRHGTATAERIKVPAADDTDFGTPIPAYLKSKDPLWQDPSYSLEVWAESPEHAIKIMNEKRLQMIAENNWVDCNTYWHRRHAAK